MNYLEIEPLPKSAVFQVKNKPEFVTSKLDIGSLNDYSSGGEYRITDKIDDFYAVLSAKHPEDALQFKNFITQGERLDESFYTQAESVAIELWSSGAAFVSGILALGGVLLKNFLKSGKLGKD